MSRKKRKSKNYDICGIIEVVNITKGHRKTRLLNFDDPPIEEKVHISGSIAIKSANYDEHATETTQKEKIHSN
tara:strand:- start:3236 stop:3454 length:219 start_codon:yes stop_codon:yes gene_type:complete